jgi:hypothetical protein
MRLVVLLLLLHAGCDRSSPTSPRVKMEEAFTRLEAVAGDPRGTSSPANEIAFLLRDLPLSTEDRAWAERILRILPRVRHARTVASLVEALGRIGDSIATPALIQATSHEDEVVRLTAYQALGAIADEDALAALRAFPPFIGPNWGWTEVLCKDIDLFFSELQGREYRDREALRHAISWLRRPDSDLQFQKLTIIAEASTRADKLGEETRDILNDVRHQGCAVSYAWRTRRN